MPPGFDPQEPSTEVFDVEVVEAEQWTARAPADGLRLERLLAAHVRRRRAEGEQEQEEQGDDVASADEGQGDGASAGQPSAEPAKTGDAGECRGSIGYTEVEARSHMYLLAAD